MTVQSWEAVYRSKTIAVGSKNDGRDTRPSPKAIESSRQRPISTVCVRSESERSTESERY
jgi:hypothetical protein